MVHSLSAQKIQKMGCFDGGIGTYCADLLTATLSLILYLVDVGTDLIAAWAHKRNGNSSWMWCTLFCIYLPRIPLVCYALWYQFIQQRNKNAQKYQIDYTEQRKGITQENERIDRAVRGTTTYCCCGECFSIFILFVPGVFEFRMLTVLVKQIHYCCAGNEHMKLMHDPLIYTAMEATFEAAPQFILQFYIILRESQTHVATTMNTTVNGVVMAQVQNTTVFAVDSVIDEVRLLGICISLIAVGLSVNAMYLADLKTRLKLTFPIAQRLVHFLWRACMVVPRLVALAFFAVRYKFLFLIFPIGHTILFFVTETIVERDYTHGNVQASIGHALISMLDCVFFYASPRENMDYVFLRGKLKAIVIVHYVMSYVENLAMLIAVCLIGCALRCQFDESWYCLSAFACVAGLPVAGAVLAGLFQALILPRAVAAKEEELARNEEEKMKNKETPGCYVSFLRSCWPCKLCFKEPVRQDTLSDQQCRAPAELNIDRHALASGKGRLKSVSDCWPCKFCVNDPVMPDVHPENLQCSPLNSREQKPI